MNRRTLPAGYAQAIHELYALQSFGIKLGLRHIRGLLRAIGSPQRQYRTIHIAGTNGKGSTAALLAAILTDAGYRTGLYTSPHLVDFRERMRVNGRTIEPERVVAWSRRLLPDVWRRRSTFFEAVTAMAFGWFSEEAVDFAVIETGLGGRLDATNVLTPVLSVITTIGLEHTAILGPTVERIAAEKAGIIKAGVPCVSGVAAGGARRVIQRRAREVGAPFIDATVRRVRIVSSDAARMRLVVRDEHGRSKAFVVGLSGTFQAENVRTVLAAVDALREAGIPVPDESVERGLRDVVPLTGVRGRLSLVHERPRTYADVGHNPPAIRSLAASLRTLRIRPSVTVIGVAADKDLPSIVRAFRSVAGSVIAVAARTSRAMPAAAVAQAFRSAGVKATEAPSVAAGVRLGRREAGPNGTVLVTGSHFVVGEALAHLERRRYLTISQ